MKLISSSEKDWTSMSELSHKINWYLHSTCVLECICSHFWCLGGAWRPKHLLGENQVLTEHFLILNVRPHPLPQPIISTARKQSPILCSLFLQIVQIIWFSSLRQPVAWPLLRCQQEVVEMMHLHPSSISGWPPGGWEGTAPPARSTAHHGKLKPRSSSI